MSVADAMAENGMKDLGYEYINLDGEMKHTSPGTHLGTAIGPPLHLGLERAAVCVHVRSSLLPRPSGLISTGDLGIGYQYTHTHTRSPV